MPKKTGFLRNSTPRKPPHVSGNEHFSPANRTKMFHVKNFGTIGASLTGA
jgi:hypothetical protein